MSRRAAWGLAALGGIAVVTVAWWSLALWPVAPDAPDWLQRARLVCFGVSVGGLPSAGGWVMLIGEPIGMLAFLLVVWGDAVAEGMQALLRTFPGRALAGALAVSLITGLGWVVLRVSEARGEPFDPAGLAWIAPSRLDRPAPPLRLVDHHGDTISLERFAGRPVLITFAYGKCHTVCPVMVRTALEAADRTRDLEPVVLVVTLDPWRDTPSRLVHVASTWDLAGEARLLGGSVATVQATLDAWTIPRQRDPNTGEIVHPTTTHIVDGRGRIAYVTGGSADRLAELMRGL